MFDIDSGKLLIVAVLALIVIGPKDLPRVLRQLGQAVGKLRRMSAEFQGQFMDAIKDAEIADIRRELKDLEKNTAFDPVRDIQAEVSNLQTEVTGAVQAIDGDTRVASPAKDFDLPAVLDAVRLEAERDASEAPTILGEGIAPVVEEAINPGDVPPQAAALRVKRKLFAKPHHSSFARLNSARTADLTGQAIAVRQRVVRAKKPLPHDALSQ